VTDGVQRAALHRKRNQEQTMAPVNATLEPAVIAALRTVRDPELPLNIYDLGLIYGLEIAPTGAVSIRMTLTTPNCPVAGVLPGQVERAVRATPGVTEVHVTLVWDPPWSRERLTPAARLQLGLDDTGRRRGPFVPASALSNGLDR
jgi:FeS assembly SUF system protein